jgi:hypothetical protein
MGVGRMGVGVGSLPPQNVVLRIYIHKTEAGRCKSRYGRLPCTHARSTGAARAGVPNWEGNAEATRDAPGGCLHVTRIGDAPERRNSSELFAISSLQGRQARRCPAIGNLNRECHPINGSSLRRNSSLGPKRQVAVVLTRC